MGLPKDCFRGGVRPGQGPRRGAARGPALGVRGAVAKPHLRCKGAHSEGLGAGQGQAHAAGGPMVEGHRAPHCHGGHAP
eukprot:8735884-Lingulodinium_polyedra.AAC.1